MKRTGAFAGALAMSLVVLGASASGAPLPSKDEEWRCVRSRNFSVSSNAKQDQVVEVALTLERFRAILSGSEATSTPTTPTVILAFKDENSFRPYKLRENGEPDGFVGKFTSTGDGNFIALCLDEQAEWRATVLHEYLHWIVDQEGRIIPLWLNEGMAEFYSTFRLRDHVIEIGRPIERHLRWLIREPLIPLPELFTIQQDSKDYNEGERVGVFYAESWALYHYLRLGRPELFDSFNAFIGSLQAGVNVNQAWEETMGFDYARMEAELLSYVRSGSYPYQTFQVGDLGIDETVHGERLAHAEVLYALGEYLAHATPWQSQEAETHLLAAMTADPTHARTQAALASLYSARGLVAQAKEHFTRAAELAPDDEEVYFRWGMSELRAYQETGPMLSMHPEPLPVELSHAREVLQRCVALNPNRAEAFVGLGTIWLYDPGDPSAGIGAFGMARNMLPSRMDVVYGLVCLSLRVGDVATAQGLMEHVLVHSRSSEWPVAAQEVLYGYAVDQFNQEHLEEVDAVLDWLEPRVIETPLLGRLQGLRREKEERAQDLERIARLQRQVDLYNAAVEHVNAGRYREALQILEPLLPQVDDEDLARTVRQTMEQLQSALGSQGPSRKP